MKALVIIDMQYGFSTALHQGTINNCVRQVVKAKKANLPIIFVEYVGHNKTVKELRDAVRGYHNKYTVKKRRDNGSTPIMNLIQKKGLVVTSFIVCGVNIGACVADTVYGLSRRFNMEVEVIKNACNDAWPNKKETFYVFGDTFFRSHNVSVI